MYQFFTALLLAALGSMNNEPQALAAGTTVATEVTVERSASEQTFENLNLQWATMPSFASFDIAYKGYELLKQQGKITSNLLAIVDFSQSSNQKRLWVIDMELQQVLYQTYVAHGRNSGDEFATRFSNKNESNQSSLGFFRTGETYVGKHGLSLRLDGLQRGVNHNARPRAIVMHGSDYVSEKFIQNHKRLGRSQGCPAVSREMAKVLIPIMKEGACLFLYHPSGETAFSQLIQEPLS